MPHYLITYTDFSGHTQSRSAKAKVPGYMRSKALQQPDCRTLGPVKEITEAEFQAHQSARSRRPETLRNRS